MGVISLLLVWDGVSAILSSVLGLYLALPDFPYRWQYSLGSLLAAWVFFALLLTGANCGPPFSPCPCGWWVPVWRQGFPSPSFQGNGG